MAFNTKSNRGESSHILINYSGPPFSHLPRDIMVNILLRLSIKRIFVCKLVCKTWHDLISEPEFAKRHFDQSQACSLIQISGYPIRSRMLYIVNPDQEDFELKLYMCDHNKYKSNCHCLVKFELDTKFKLPFRNPQMIFTGKDSRCNRLNMKDHKYRVVNSCNGLLCLSCPSDNDPLVVCNPITGEFINLPNSKKIESQGEIMSCGLGFSPASNQYKVIRIFQNETLDPRRTNFIDWGITAEIHTLGTETWKEIDFSAEEIFGLCPTYFNGFLYWPCQAPPFCVISFDVENERVRSISRPPMGDYRGRVEVRIGVLGGELSVSCYLNSGETEVWVMKGYGVWSKVFSFCLDGGKIWHFGPCLPVKYLNNEAMLLFNSSTNSFIYKHPRKPGFQYFKLQQAYALVELTAYVPSFVSLKDVLSGLDVKVLESRRMEIKLQNEDTCVYVQEVCMVDRVK